MAGGTLVISREVNNHAYHKMRLEALGFSNVTMTDLEKDALNFLIRELKPKLIIMGAHFYECCTPFLLGQLKQMFPKIKMAAVSIGKYPDELAMYFILNGAKSYVSSFDGTEELLKQLTEISKGGEYVSPAVNKRIAMREDQQMYVGKITERHIEVIRLICCGYKDLEIADTLHISRRTVDNHKTDIFTTLNVRGSNELIRAALTLGIVKLDEMYFYPKGFTVNPKPKKKKKLRRTA